MWTRDETKPTTYKGQPFRSHIEAVVAEQLDRLKIKPWFYEHPYQNIAGIQSDVPYLPDFTIPGQDSDPYRIPLWLEVKPAGLLYAMRDHAQLPERFEGNHRFNWSAYALRQSGIEEIWKPKQLAEDSGCAVLAVSAINRNHTLSVLLAPEWVEFSRSHPAVNWNQVLTDRKKAERQRQWQAEYEQRQQELARQQAVYRRQIIARAQTLGFPAKRAGICDVCRQPREADQLLIYRDTYWVAVCREHLNTSRRTSHA